MKKIKIYTKLLGTFPEIEKAGIILKPIQPQMVPVDVVLSEIEKHKSLLYFTGGDATSPITKEDLKYYLPEKEDEKKEKKKIEPPKKPTHNNNNKPDSKKDGSEKDPAEIEPPKPDSKGNGKNK